MSPGRKSVLAVIVIALILLPILIYFRFDTTVVVVSALALGVISVFLGRKGL